MKKRRITIGYIFCDRGPKKDEKAFLKIAKKKNIDMIMFNVSEEIDDNKIEENVRKCDVIFNNSAEVLALELVKTFESLGKKVFEPSKIYYYIEDKWLFYLKCKEHKIPTLETNLLSENINLAKKELKKFSSWPVILKGIEGCQGEYVEKAENLKEAERILEKFWRKQKERLPVIAQEFVRSPCYRVTVIDNKIIQSSIKENHGWKATGVYAKRVKRFKPDAKLKKIIKKISKTCGISILGIDFLRRNKEWLVLEVNAEPGLDFFVTEREKLISLILDFLIKKAKGR